MKRRLMIGMAVAASVMALAPLAASAVAAPATGGVDGDQLRLAHGPTIHVYDQDGRSLVRPRQYVITGTAAMSGLRWGSWGGEQAVAVGNLKVETCRPNCAQGGTSTYRAQLQLRGSEEVEGVKHYAEYRVVADANTPAAVRDEYGAWSPTPPPPES